MYEQALQLIKEYDRIIIHRHSRPDGDAIGAQTGLRCLIRDNFPEKRVSVVGDAPGRYGFVPGSDPETVEDEGCTDGSGVLPQGSGSLQERD